MSDENEYEPIEFMNAEAAEAVQIRDVVWQRFQQAKLELAIASKNYGREKARLDALDEVNY